MTWTDSSLDTELSFPAPLPIAPQERQRLLHTVISTFNEGLVLGDEDGELFYWNPAALSMHGFQSMEECAASFDYFLQLFELSTLDGEQVPFENWPFSRLFRGEALTGLELRVHH